jgi:hypothetical protein
LTFECAAAEKAFAERTERDAHAGANRDSQALQAYEAAGDKATAAAVAADGMIAEEDTVGGDDVQRMDEGAAVTANTEQV